MPEAVRRPDAGAVSSFRGSHVKDGAAPGLVDVGDGVPAPALAPPALFVVPVVVVRVAAIPAAAALVAEVPAAEVPAAAALDAAAPDAVAPDAAFRAVAVRAVAFPAVAIPAAAGVPAAGSHVAGFPGPAVRDAGVPAGDAPAGETPADGALVGVLVDADLADEAHAGECPADAGLADEVPVVAVSPVAVDHAAGAPAIPFLDHTPSATSTPAVAVVPSLFPSLSHVLVQHLPRPTASAAAATLGLKRAAESSGWISGGSGGRSESVGAELQSRPSKVAVEMLVPKLKHS